MKLSLPTLSAYFKLREKIIVLSTTTFTQVLEPNANRYSVLFCSVSGGQIDLARTEPASKPGSLTLANAANASIQFITLTFEEHGALVHDQWWAVSDGIIAQTLGVNEVIWQPPVELL